MLYKKQQRFVRFDGDEMLRLNENVQVMKLNNEIYALDIDNFERNFGFESLIIKRATETIEEIEQIGILEDVGASYILLRSVENDNLVYCDIYAIKFITISRRATYGNMNNTYYY